MKIVLVNAVLLLSTTTILAGEAAVDSGIPGLPPSATQSRSSGENAQRIAAAQAFPVPIPLHTPFDADSKARITYIESFCAGYRRGTARIIGFSTPTVDTPYREAFIAGNSDGQRAGSSKHPIHVLDDGGLSVYESFTGVIRDDWGHLFASQVELINAHTSLDDCLVPATRIFGGTNFVSLPAKVGQAILSAPPLEVMKYLEQILALQPEEAWAKPHIAKWVTVAKNLDGASYTEGLQGMSIDDGPVTWHPVYTFAFPYPPK